MRGKTIIILCLILLLPITSAESNCVTYGYFESDGIEHRSLLTNKGYHFGNKLTVLTNCQIDIFIDDQLFTDTNSSSEIFLQNGFHNIRFEGHNYTQNYTSIYVQGGSFLENSVNSNTSIISDQTLRLSVDDFNSGKVLVALGNSAILFVLITVVYWNLINRYIDRSYFEEVIS